MLLPVTFNPRSDKYVAYEFACACFALVTILVVPLQFAFLPTSFALMGIEYALAALGVVNQFVRAHTMYHDDEGLPVSHPSRTALKYVKSIGFLMDLITWFPFELIVLASMPSSPLSHQQLKFVALFRCLRLVSLYKIVRFFDYHFAEISIQRTWLKYLSYTVYSLIIHHWFACILFSFACPPQFGPHDPTSGDHIRLNSSASATYCEAGSWFAAALQSHPSLGMDRSVFAQYAVSLYWATSTLIGVGYGDIHARTLKEQVAAAVVMLAGHVYYSCVLGELSASMQSADIRRAEYTSKLGHIARFLRVYRVGAEKSRRVTEYYHYLWQRTRGVSPDQLLANLPPALRTTVCQSMYSDNISLCLEGLRHGESGGGVVSGDERRSFHRLLSSFVKPMICMERSVIFREGDVGEEMYFIERGAVQVLDIDNCRPITTLTAGDYFGDEALLFDKPRNRTVVAQSLCELYFTPWMRLSWKSGNCRSRLLRSSLPM
ncbi:MAG: ion transporter, partial [Planctomycetota bacterium]